MLRWFRRTPPPPTEPQAFSPWLPPPLGSAGVEWDGQMDFPRDLISDRRAEADRQKSEERQRRQQASDINRRSLEIRRPWHAWTIAAACLLVCSLTSTGSFEFLRIPLAVLSIGSAGISIHRIRNNNVFHRGVGLSILMILIALGWSGWSLRRLLFPAP